jgi:hypothetical protein
MLTETASVWERRTPQAQGARTQSAGVRARTDANAETNAPEIDGVGEGVGEGESDTVLDAVGEFESVGPVVEVAEAGVVRTPAHTCRPVSWTP